MSRADPMATARRGERHFSCSRPRRSCSRPGRRPAAHRPKWGCRRIQPGCATAPVQFEPLSTRPWGVVADGSHGAGDVDARTTPQSTPAPPVAAIGHRAPQARNRRLKLGRCHKPASARCHGTLSWSGTASEPRSPRQRGLRGGSCSPLQAAGPVGRGQRADTAVPDQLRVPGRRALAGLRHLPSLSRRLRAFGAR